ncbi:MAG: NAD-dependent epimerase/dehydratase family protein [bacterium]|nr:NAD-dependent epimerase/dehydratase family protein [bacterium]
MRNILVIGGTRNLGHLLVHRLVEQGDQVTVFNRGMTRDELPESVERLHGDRTEKSALAAALKGRTFDAVVDTALYKGEEAQVISQLLHGSMGQYIFLSSGQVYLVREGIERPFTEAMYPGRTMPAPKSDTYSYEEWLYGMDKRAAEDHLHAAYAEHGFPVTTLRLPMVTGERDHFGRLYGYVLRLKDEGPVLVPSTPNHPLRHVYSGDVVDVILKLLASGAGIGKAYNISQDETVTLDEFLSMIAAIMGVEPLIVRVRRDKLEANGFVPDCSPFSERWMSELDNTLSKTELGVTYTPLADYLRATVTHLLENTPPMPVGYKRRRAEITFYQQVMGQVEIGES